MTLQDPRFDPESLATALAAARRDGGTVPPPATDLSFEDAYAVQVRVAELLNARQIGWKVGSTSAAAQARLGTSEPGAGPLLDAFCYEDAGSAAVHTAHDLHVEAEFAYRLGRDLAPRSQPWTPDELRAAVDAFLPAMELVGSRYEGGLASSGRGRVTADGGADVGFVAGTPVLLAPDWDHRSHPVTQFKNGESVASGHGFDALDDPLNVLTWLANHLSRRNLTLNAGDLVTTGTCTGLVRIAPGDHLEADFGELGRVSLTLTQAPA